MDSVWKLRAVVHTFYRNALEWILKLHDSGATWLRIFGTEVCCFEQQGDDYKTGTLFRMPSRDGMKHSPCIRSRTKHPHDIHTLCFTDRVGSGATSLRIFGTEVYCFEQHVGDYKTGAMCPTRCPVGLRPHAFRLTCCARCFYVGVLRIQCCNVIPIVTSSRSYSVWTVVCMVGILGTRCRYVL